MRLLTTLATAASIAAIATAPMAGGLANEIMEAPVEVVDEMAPAGPSINPTYIVLGVLAALLIANALSDDDDEPDEPEVVMVSELN